MSDWIDKIDEVDRLIANGHPKQAMQEAGGLLEQLLRHVYAQVASHVSAPEQTKLAAATAKVSAGKPVGEMTLGQLVGLFREGKVFDLAEMILKRKLPHLKGADFNTFVEIRNRSVHKGESVSEEEAKFFAAQLRLFLKSLGLLPEPTKPGAESPASAKSLRPWTELVKLHGDVEAGDFDEAVFAIDLGLIGDYLQAAAGRVPALPADAKVPKVYSDPASFFGATYVTNDLKRLLEEVLGSLAGQGNFNRVLKLRSPFGGGKSHVLLSLLHAALSRSALNQIPERKSFPDPGAVAWAVFDGEKFTAGGEKAVGNGKTVQTMWGWLAWQLGPEAWAVMEKFDAMKVSPGGDDIRRMLSAPGKPVLLLLDEVLKYMERAAAVPVHESTLQRQAKDFLQSLTVEVASSQKAVMVYSLQWSARESLGNVALLEELDKLTSRKDQVREPSTGDEVLAVIKRRLLDAEPDAAVAKQVAREYSDVIGGMLKAQAESPSAQQDAQSQTIELRKRMEAAYPFHPALIDVMVGRWTSVDGFQRTRGALRFLASCLHALKKRGGAKPLLGPAEVPISDVDVARAMLKDLDPQQGYTPVLQHDLAGPNARTKRIDDRLGKETPALANVRPATRLATAILAYSFGGLKRESGADTLPPGVTETELLAACVGPDLDRVTATSVLNELRNTCLYLHYDGVKYCFKKDPNVTKLIEDAEQEVARDSDAVRERIKEMLGRRLAGKNEAVIWPEKSQELPDREPQFLVGYLPLDFAMKGTSQQEQDAKEILSKYGDAPRRYRNGVGLAIPDRKPIESLRRAVRYLMAVDRVDEKKKQHRLTPDQLDQLKERRRTEENAAEAAFRVLYPSVWLPRVNGGGTIDLEKVEVGGRPLQATGVHERVMELLTAVGTPKLHGSLHPRKIAERVKLGEALAAGEAPRLGVGSADVRDAFFSFLEPPRISSASVLRKAIARGVSEGTFAYTTGIPTLGSDGKYQVSLTKVAVNRSMSDDEVDLDAGFLMVPMAVPAPEPPPGEPAPAPGPTPPVTPGPGPTPPTPPPGGGPSVRTAVRIRFAATREQVFKSFQAIANLADKSDGAKITIQIDGASSSGYDPSWLRNAVEEPLDEANIDGLEME